MTSIALHFVEAVTDLPGRPQREWWAIIVVGGEARNAPTGRGASPIDAVTDLCQRLADMQFGND